VPTRDVNNPDARLRGHPILGLQVLSGFTRNGNDYTGGTAYDPKSGRSYRASLRQGSDIGLAVTGCVLVFCRTAIWGRMR
jgi:uncharacterized protein (DUF2147 family)